MTGDELPTHIFFFRAKAHSVLMCSNLAFQRVVTIMTHISGPGGRGFIRRKGKASNIVLLCSAACRYALHSHAGQKRTFIGFFLISDTDLKVRSFPSVPRLKIFASYKFG